jgi:hypothetical protein
MNRSIDRYCEAAVAGCAVPVVVGIVAAIVSVCKSGHFHTALENSLVFAVFSWLPSALSASTGMMLRRIDRACVYGAIVFLIVTWLGFQYWYHWIILIELYHRGPQGWATCVGMVMFTAVLGALTGGAGAVIGRIAPGSGAGSSRLRLSRRELMVGGALMGIELFYVLLAV